MPVLEKERGALRTVRPQSLCEFLASRGGVRTMYNGRSTMGADDLIAMDADRWHRAKPFRQKLLRVDEGMTPDYAGVCAYEAGYFQARPEVNELLDLIATDLASGCVYSERDRDEIQRLALSDEDEEEITYDAPPEFRVPLHLRTIKPVKRLIPARSVAMEGPHGTVAYMYQFTTQRRHGLYVSPYLARALGGAEAITKFCAKCFKPDDTAPALHAAWDSEVARAWFVDDFFNGPPF